MVMYAPDYVQPPAFTPLPYGLFSVVQWQSTSEADTKWTAGVQFQPGTCDDIGTTVMYCPGAEVEPIDKDIIFGVNTVGSNAYATYAKLNCSPVGGVYEESVSRVLAALDRRGFIQVERTLWSGTVTNGQMDDVIYPHLAADTAVYTPGDGEVLLQPAASILATGYDLIDGLAILEAELAECYGGVGVIHAPRVALPYMARDELIHPMGMGPDAFMMTAGGNKVAFGTGYTNTGPDGSAAGDGQAWLYATGSIMGRRSTPRVTSTPAQGLDRSVNTLQLTAEQNYSLSFDCCLLAVLVDLNPNPCCTDDD